MCDIDGHHVIVGTQALLAIRGIDTASITARSGRRRRARCALRIDGKAAALCDRGYVRPTPPSSSLKRRGLRRDVERRSQGTAEAMRAQPASTRSCEVLPDGKVEAIKSLQHGGHLESRWSATA
jgi:hypothetical protein